MSKYTPGPWSVGHVRNRGSLHSFNDLPVHVGAHGVNGGQGNAVAIVHMGGNGATSNTVEDLEANARLIAACPEMYELLRDISDNGTITRDLQTRLDALLSKISEAAMDGGSK